MNRKLWAFVAVAVAGLAAYVTVGSGDAETTPLASVAAVETAAPAPQVAPVAGTLVVYKSPTCGCCGDWVEHMEANGFVVESRDVNQAELMQVKQKHGFRAEHSSCHTALIDGYAFEGHVPADLVRRFLQERPDKIGLAVPGMPVGSPGMEMGARKDPYDVLAIDANGAATVYESR